MKRLTTQQYADLSKDAYETRQVTKGDNSILVEGNRYKVLAVHDNPKTGYQGTVYQDVKTNEIVVAHRGTESPKKDPFDAKTDIKMVLDRINMQEKDAEKLTQMAIEKAELIHQKNPNEPRPYIHQTGHSLGGTLAQMMAYRFKQEGITFNAYGAADLKGIPQGGNSVTNYIKASDPVAAAAPHFGKNVLLAQHNDIVMLAATGYTNNRTLNAVLPQGTVRAAAGAAFYAHTIDNFTGKDSILSAGNYTRARELAEQYGQMFTDYRRNVETDRSILHGIKRTFDQSWEAYRQINKKIDQTIDQSWEMYKKAGKEAGEILDKSWEMYRKLREEIDKDSSKMSHNSFEPRFNQAAPVLTLNDMPQKAQELCRQCREHLVAFDKNKGTERSTEDTDKIALAMGVKSYAAGLPEVQFIHIQKDGQINLGYESPQGMFKDTSIHTDKALATTLEENVTQSRQTERDFALAAEQRAREAAEYHAQSRGMTMG